MNIYKQAMSKTLKDQPTWGTSKNHTQLVLLINTSAARGVSQNLDSHDKHQLPSYSLLSEPADVTAELQVEQNGTS